MTTAEINTSTSPSNQPGLATRLQALAGGPVKRKLAQWELLLPRIGQLEPLLKEETNVKLRKRSLALRYEIKSGVPVASVLPEAFALVREASRRLLDMRHFDVQILGGIAIFNGCVAEMVTGEGKTLTATLPLYLQALSGKGVHLATVNDYLAKRDAEWMEPIYNLLGLKVGVIQTEMDQAQRRQAYASDITYGTAKEFGFDFLRDRLLKRRLFESRGGGLGVTLSDQQDSRGGGEQPVQRAPHFVIVDEADSVLIDEARTPLIISALRGDAQDRIVDTYKWAAVSVDHFLEDEHYEYDHEKRKVELTAQGRQLVRSLPKSEKLNSVGLIDFYEFSERAIKIRVEFTKDQHYVVREGEIVIVDESTGRLAEGRKWRNGIHQAIEAREKVKVTVDTGQAARVTVQDFFLRYEQLGGMTGTATTSARELYKFYRLRVIPIPTNKPIQRQWLPDRVFGTSEDKWNAVVEEVREMHDQDRPVLIGTRSIDKSELLSKKLVSARIAHKVLNAHHIAAEADIVARAGQKGHVTVSTNMAGRGTDIKLGNHVAELGGLHVICTELHHSARIDRQLSGRGGRQGDPGTMRQYYALDDEILNAAFGPKKADQLKKLGLRIGKSLTGLVKLLRKAQVKVENKHFSGRKMLVHHERQRKKMQIEMGQDPYLDSTH